MAATTPTLFQDFDDQGVFRRFRTLAESHETLNFVVDFNEEKAQCAFDLSAANVKQVLDDKVSSDAAHRHEPHRKTCTRWINIWRPEKQKDVIKAIANHYGLSPRLALSMRSEPLKPQLAKQPPSRSERVRQALHQGGWRSQAHAQMRGAAKAHADLESSQKTTERGRRSPDLNHYRIVNEIWHFFSVDWGHRYTSIGYNQVYETETPGEPGDSEVEQSRPEGKRVWMWLLLCDNNTVISINENPFPGTTALDDDQQYDLETIRYNMLNVFDQISKATDGDQMLNPIMTVQVRAGRNANLAESHVRDEDSASLLLYYLFDDWFTSYSLVAKSDHKYKRQLNSIRQEMFRSARLDHVHELHSLDTRLNILKRMYAGYNLIIERLLNRTKQIAAESKRHGRDEDEKSGLPEADKFQAEGYGVHISAAAALRFERLKDRISLYLLSEIQSCLEEKDSLMSMNFNLIAIKEESYIERLTRITILLAKVTILFIPVSVVAAYFGINFTDEQFTVKQFWVSFSVIFFLSFLGLLLFGYVSGTRETGPIYESLTRMVIKTWRAFRKPVAKRQPGNPSSTAFRHRANHEKHP